MNRQPIILHECLQKNFKTEKFLWISLGRQDKGVNENKNFVLR